APSVFFDVTIDGEPAGRITIELFGDVEAGASRFAQLAAGQQGVDYRLSKFNGVLPTYIRNAGLNKLSYSATEASPIDDLDSIDELEAELDKQQRRHDVAGLVSLIVREKDARPIKERLVARDGKLITVLEQAGEAPNGTQFAITTAPSPDLDATNLIIGRVVEGNELLGRIAALPVNKPRNDNPYFVAGKAMGDKRAVTAERAFYRPFLKVVVSKSGLLGAADS
ncbi:Peptidyl-prolyl cis-trans isomerase H, partial [Tetrabaena socialis]